jgi:uncharacterized membrane protein YjjP (DUF1212 family)
MEECRTAQREVYRAIDLALRIGEVVLSSGAGTADTTATILAVTAACGLRGCEVDITFTSITVAYQPTPDSAPQTHLRVVRYRAIDYSRLTAVDSLVRRLAAGELNREQASHELAAITSARHAYPRWASSLAWGVMSGGATLLLGGGWLITVVAFLTAIAIDLSARWFTRQRLPPFYQQLAGAVLAMAVAMALSTLHAPAQPSLVVAAGIIMLLAGLPLTGAVQDALTGYYVTAAGRSLESLLLTGGIIAGVSLGLTVGLRLGLSLAVGPESIHPGNEFVMGAAGGLMAVAFAFASYAPLRSLLPVAMAGVLGSVSFALVTRAGFGPAWATAGPPSWSGSAATRSGAGSGFPRWWSWSRPRFRCCPGSPSIGACSS